MMIFTKTLKQTVTLILLKLKAKKLFYSVADLTCWMGGDENGKGRCKHFFRGKSQNASRLLFFSYFSIFSFLDPRIPTKIILCKYIYSLLPLLCSSCDDEGNREHIKICVCEFLYNQV